MAIGIILGIVLVVAAIGLFIGAMLPFLFSAFTMQAVGRAAHKIVIEVRRQFKEIAGLTAFLSFITLNTITMKYLSRPFCSVLEIGSMRAGTMITDAPLVLRPPFGTQWALT